MKRSTIYLLNLLGPFLILFGLILYNWFANKLFAQTYSYIGFSFSLLSFVVKAAGIILLFILFAYMRSKSNSFLFRISNFVLMLCPFILIFFQAPVPTLIYFLKDSYNLLMVLSGYYGALFLLSFKQR